MKCKNCGNDTFKIVVKTDCSDCAFNGAWDGEKSKYIYTEKIINKRQLCRDQVEQEGECELGSSFGDGCYTFMCAICATVDFLPLRCD